MAFKIRDLSICKFHPQDLVLIPCSCQGMSLIQHEGSREGSVRSQELSRNWSVCRVQQQEKVVALIELIEEIHSGNKLDD